MTQRKKAEDGAGSGNHRPGIGKRVEEIGSTAQHLLDEAKGAVSDLQSSLDLRSRVERHPYGMLVAAATVGYVLGGGLFTSLTGSVLRLGLRLAAVPLVKNELMNLAGSALGGFGTQQESEEQPPSSESND